MISFTVQGQPVAQGSKVAYMPKGAKRPILMETARERLKPWRTQIAAAAREEMRGEPPTHMPVRVCLYFTFQRPKGHYGTGKNGGVVKESSPRWHATKPDADKLARACLDAMTGIAYRDDSQVAGLTVEKVYGEEPGVTVHVEPADAEAF